MTTQMNSIEIEKNLFERLAQYSLPQFAELAIKAATLQLVWGLEVRLATAADGYGDPFAYFQVVTPTGKVVANVGFGFVRGEWQVGSITDLPELKDFAC